MALTKVTSNLTSFDSLLVDSNNTDTTITIESDLDGSSLFTSGIDLKREGTSKGSRIESIRDASTGGVGLKFLTTADNAAEVSGTLTSRMVILEDGNVGIGTSSPASGVGSPLTLTSTSTGYVGLRLNGTGSYANDWDLYASGDGAGLDYFGIYDRTNTAYRMVVTNTGNVGIGTISPDYTLSVAGVIEAEPATELAGANAGANFLHYSTNNFSYFNGAYGANGVFFGEATGATRVGMQTGQTMTFETNGSERMRIHSSGDFTVGNTGAVGTWYNGGSTGFGFSSGAYCGIVRSGTNTPLYVSTTGTGAGGFVEFNQATTVRGNITFNGSSTLYNATSDYRLKENVVELPNALQRVGQLNPVQFDWIESGISSEGFLAHEAQAVVPYSVTGQQDELYTADNTAEEQVDLIGQPKYQTMDYGKLTPLLVKAIQEQQTLIEELKTRIETLENS